jgi:hypothetical protein
VDLAVLLVVAVRDCVKESLWELLPVVELVKMEPSVE